MLFIMLNPSDADAEVDDPTVRRCVGFADGMGVDEMLVVNLFAYRASKPGDVLSSHKFHRMDPNLRVQDVVGPDNDAWITSAVDYTKKLGGTVVAAWGVHGGGTGRDEVVINIVMNMGVDLHYLSRTKEGHPRHRASA